MVEPVNPLRVVAAYLGKLPRLKVAAAQIECIPSDIDSTLLTADPEGGMKAAITSAQAFGARG
jgi:hypothetical protein